MPWHAERARLVDLLKLKGIHDERVLAVISKTPRHLFVEKAYLDSAYDDHALPLTHGQTISQPYVVAKMTELLLHGQKLQRVLEVGTGSGYQAAILSQLVDHVYSIERIKPLLEKAKRRLKHLHLNNVEFLYGDGSFGWPEYAPFDGILVTAAATYAPDALLAQLADGGRMIIPVGGYGGQELQVITRDGDQYHKEVHEYVVFVPLLPGKQ